MVNSWSEATAAAAPLAHAGALPVGRRGGCCRAPSTSARCTGFQHEIAAAFATPSCPRLPRGR
eukprot:5035373-Prymnesium_polylepis.3